MGLFGGLGDSLFGSGDPAKDAANAQKEGIRDAIGEYRTGYEGQQALWDPFRNFGMEAMGGIRALNSGDYSGFQNSPDYQYALQQGLAGVGSQAGQMGNLFSGARLTAANNKAQGLATQNLGNYRNSLYNQLGYGQNATNALSGALMNTTQGIANANMGLGDAGASRYINASNAGQNAAGNWMNFGGNVLQGFLGGGGTFSGLFGGG